MTQLIHVLAKKKKTTKNGRFLLHVRDRNPDLHVIPCTDGH